MFLVKCENTPEKSWVGVLAFNPSDNRFLYLTIYPTMLIFFYIAPLQFFPQDYFYVLFQFLDSISLAAKSLNHPCCVCSALLLPTPEVSAYLMNNRWCLFYLFHLWAPHFYTCHLVMALFRNSCWNMNAAKFKRNRKMKLVNPADTIQFLYITVMQKAVNNESCPQEQDHLL